MQPSVFVDHDNYVTRMLRAMRAFQNWHWWQNRTVTEEDVLNFSDSFAVWLNRAEDMEKAL